MRKGRTHKSRAIPGAAYQYTVRILSHPVHVFKIVKFQDEEIQGEFHPDTHEVYVTHAPSRHAQADREMHELLHAASTLVLPTGSRLNELQVNTLSLALVDMIANNPHLVIRLGWLTGMRTDKVIEHEFSQ